jgi:hypothetical protein
MDLGYAKMWFVNYFTTTKIESCSAYTNLKPTPFCSGVLKIVGGIGSKPNIQI